MQDLPKHLQPIRLVSSPTNDSLKTPPVLPSFQTVAHLVDKVKALSDSDQELVDRIMNSAQGVGTQVPVIPEREEMGMDEKTLVTYLETQYWLKGYPLWTELLEKSHWDEEYLRLVVHRIQGSLESRGLPAFNAPSPRSEFPDWESEYDPEFVLAVNYITNTSDKRSSAAKLKALNISPRKWEGYLVIEKNYLYYKMMVESRWVRAEEKAKIALMAGIEEGDLSTIKYFHEYTGRHVQNNMMTININAVFARLMDVLAAELDSETLTRISEKMETITVESRELTA